ncbi:hypothetical protein G6F70_009341 [Rhizopus microsporus]|nr:hypothetical protein G6F70_009341 [Rhizopus microsporus]
MQLKKNLVGRPQSLSTQEARLVLRKFSTGDFRNAEEAAKSLRSLGTQISAQTVRNLLSAANFKAVYKRPVSPLTTVRKKARLQFARKYKHWTVDDWRHVVFSDETKVNRLGSNGKQWTWIQEGRPLQDHNVNHVYKHGGGSIFLWSCFTAKGSGYITEILGGLNPKLHCQILSEDLMATLDDYHLNTADIVFQQDNDPKHRSKLAIKLFQENNVKLLWSGCGVSRDTHSWMTHDSPACPYLGLLKASHLHDHTPPTWTGLSSLDILLVM